MREATLSADGGAFVIMPTVDGRNDYAGIRSVCEQMGAHFDGSLKRYTMPIRDVATLLRVGMAGGLYLHPTRNLAGAVRAEAAKIREQHSFIERVCDGLDLYPYQSEGVGYLWRNPGALLFDEPGLGKTVQALAAIEPETPALVVCPAFLKGVWAKEAARWRPELDCAVPDAFRWPEPGEIVVTNYARLPDTGSLKSCGKPWAGTTLICDEGHYLKNGRARRTVRARVIGNRTRKAGGRVWILTATPLLNEPKELWSLLVMLQRHKSAFGGYGNFARLFGGEEDAFGYVFKPENVSDDARRILRSIALRRERADVLPDLPTKIYETYDIPPPNDRELIEQLDSIDMDLIEIALDGAEPVLQDIALLASARQELATYKANAIGQLLDAYQEHAPLLVFSAHKAAVESVGRRPGWDYMHGSTPLDKRQALADAFQRGELRGLAATIKVMQGWTLTRAHRAIFIDRTFTPGENLQAEDRVCRIGQDRGVIITDVVCGHAIDRAVNKLLLHKQNMVAATTGQLASSRVSATLELAAELDSFADMLDDVR